MAGVFEEFPGVEWVEGAGEFIKVVEGRCSGCAHCVRVCLGSCYEISGKVARIKSLENCMECAACWYVCPEDAVEFNWPPGGKGFRSDWG